jgi:DHA2 family multidrug resistance protein
VILPQWIQGYLGYRSVDAGLVTASLGIFAVLLAPVMVKIMAKSDARVLTTLAFIGYAGVFFMRSHYTHGRRSADADSADTAARHSGRALTAIILSDLPADRIPAAAGLSRMFAIASAYAGLFALVCSANCA